MSSNVGGVHTQINPQDLQHPVLSFLKSYWDEKRASRPMPSRADLRPSDMKEHLGWILLLDVLPGAEDFRLRTVGTRVSALALAGCRDVELLLTGDATALRGHATPIVSPELGEDHVLSRRQLHLDPGAGAVDRTSALARRIHGHRNETASALAATIPRWSQDPVVYLPSGPAGTELDEHGRRCTAEFERLVATGRPAASADGVNRLYLERRWLWRRRRRLVLAAREHELGLGQRRRQPTRLAGPGQAAHRRPHSRARR